jgi:hypothetical protein
MHLDRCSVLDVVRMVNPQIQNNGVPKSCGQKQNTVEYSLCVDLCQPWTC